MAITLISQQATPLESFTNAVWRVSSDDPNIRKMSATFIGSNGNAVAGAITLQVQPSIAGTAVFDIDVQEFFRDNLTYNIQTPAIAARQYTALESYFTLGIVQFVELLNSNGVLVLGDDLNLTPSSVVINAARQVYNAAGLPNKVISTSGGFGQFLTNSPRTIDIATGESYVLSLYTDSTSINAISVNFRDSAGNSLASHNISYTATIGGRYDIAIGLANLATAGITPPAGAYDYRISVGVLSGSYTRHSEFFVFKIATKCDGDVRVHFLNRWGGFDSFTFTGYNDESIQTKSTQFEKYLSNGFTPQDRGAQAQYRDVIQIRQLNSKAISNEQLQWLAELIGSPVAYIEENSQLIPITIDDATKKVSDRNNVSTLQLTVRLANNIRNQRL